MEEEFVFFIGYETEIFIRLVRAAMEKKSTQPRKSTQPGKSTQPHLSNMSRTFYVSSVLYDKISFKNMKGFVKES
jgi:hypothetical protein